MLMLTFIQKDHCIYTSCVSRLKPCPRQRKHCESDDRRLNKCCPCALEWNSDERRCTRDERENTRDEHGKMPMSGGAPAMSERTLAMSMEKLPMSGGAPAMSERIPAMSVEKCRWAEVHPRWAREHPRWAWENADERRYNHDELGKSSMSMSLPPMSLESCTLSARPTENHCSEKKRSYTQT